MPPRFLDERLQGLRRDLAELARSLRGESPPFLVPRVPRATPWPSSTAGELLHARRMRVVQVVRETAQAVTLVLEDVDGAPVHFAPGQFFTLLVPWGGALLRRAYSASCLPGALGPARVAVTVKRVEGGRASTFLTTQVVEGTLLQVLGPSGRFGAPRSEGPQQLLLVAGGSGITPLLPIAQALLQEQPGAHVVLLCGNRREEDILFRPALEALERAHAPRLQVRHLLSEPPPGWSGGVGRLSRERLAGELAALALQDFTALLCGPLGMLAEARAALRAQGVPEERIVEERFSAPALRPLEPLLPAAPQPLELRLADGTRRHLTVAAGATVLEAGLAAGVALPYSCALGGCGACRVRVHAGEVQMEAPHCLGEAERAQGYALACVARPLGPLVVEVAPDAAAGGLR